MDPTVNSPHPPPAKRQRQHQSCPSCCISLSKSSFYEHVSQCCPESSVGPAETENLSFELDEGKSEALLHGELSNYDYLFTAM